MKPASASPPPAAYCQEPSSRVQHFFIGHLTSTATIVHLLLIVVLVVVLTVSRPHHLPHCNVAIVFPCDHVQSSTVVHFLRRDSTCRSPCSLRGLPELLPRHIVFVALVVMPRCSVTCVSATSRAQRERASHRPSKLTPLWPCCRDHSILQREIGHGLPSHSLSPRGFSHTSSLPRSSFAVFSPSVTVVDRLFHGDSVMTFSA